MANPVGREAMLEVLLCLLPLLEGSTLGNANVKGCENYSANHGYYNGGASSQDAKYGNRQKRDSRLREVPHVYVVNGLNERELCQGVSE